jgi:hypothetical protein
MIDIIFSKASVNNLIGYDANKLICFREASLCVMYRPVSSASHVATDTAFDMRDKQSRFSYFLCRNPTSVRAMITQDSVSQLPSSHLTEKRIHRAAV